MQKRKKYVVITFIVAVLIIVVAIIFFVLRKQSDKGVVIGDNPANIPISELPTCNFTGASFVITPCYSPPGATYE